MNPFKSSHLKFDLLQLLYVLKIKLMGFGIHLHKMNQRWVGWCPRIPASRQGGKGSAKAAGVAACGLDPSDLDCKPHISLLNLRFADCQIGKI